MAREMDAVTFQKAMISGPLPKEGLTVHGQVTFGRLSHALPNNLQVDSLTLVGIPWLYSLPAGLHCQFLILRDLPIQTLPEDLAVTEQLVIERCPQVERLPKTLSAKSLILQDCAQLTSLPECPKLLHLNISGCSGLQEWPDTGPAELSNLLMAGCTRLHSLPPWLKGIRNHLDVRNCTALRELPEDLRIDHWADIAGCHLPSLPKYYRDGKEKGRIRWRGVIIDEQIACHPETLRAQDVFNNPNVEVRRVMIERMGYERFLAEANAETLDQDQDAGGSRRLLLVPLKEDEPLVCLAVLDPSTGRRYVLRVPPNMQSCHQAAAWIAGFENPDDYHPIAET